MSAEFDCIASHLDYPMVIVTAASGQERSGCLVGFSTQCSIKPPRYLVCISKANHTYGVAAQAEGLVVHFPTAAESGLAALFGSETGDEVDKFSRCVWQPGPSGAPVLDGVKRWFAGRVREQVDLGDHVGFVLDVGDAACAGDDPPLGFQSVRDLPPGHPA
ncbi:MAG TPA: flavin reductase family protein [Acidimicrobiales bacterium]|jgi:flavin reductase (DIM6/NTAB) family NADH-FMN oxidoreductase RutF|nr:flavin reductase family protein [Acidimicrobiales bacterium]